MADRRTRDCGEVRVGEMSVSLYLVALTEPSLKVEKKVKSEWPDHHFRVSETLYFVAAKGVATAQTIRERLGITTDRKAPWGIVAPMVKTSGVLSGEAVDWYRAALDE